VALGGRGVWSGCGATISRAKLRWGEVIRRANSCAEMEDVVK
jgi:hypothetical protein